MCVWENWTFVDSGTFQVEKKWKKFFFSGNFHFCFHSTIDSTIDLDRSFFYVCLFDSEKLMIIIINFEIKICFPLIKQKKQSFHIFFHHQKKGKKLWRIYKSEFSRLKISTPDRFDDDDGYFWLYSSNTLVYVMYTQSVCAKVLNWFFFNCLLLLLVWLVVCMMLVCLLYNTSHNTP
mgnify:CR=1 FL=1